MKTNSNKNLASTASVTSTSASNPNLQSASGSSHQQLIQTQAPSMQSSSHSSTSVSNVSTCSNPMQIKQTMSVSMTSLPSPQHTTHGGGATSSSTFSTLLQQSTDMAGAGNEFLSPNKIVIDRTYNSLKVSCF